MSRYGRRIVQNDLVTAQYHLWLNQLSSPALIHKLHPIQCKMRALL